MNPDGVDVLNKADRDHLVLGIAHHFQFELFPAQHRFLDQDLPDQAGRDAARGDDAQFLDVVDQAAARSAHRISRPDHHRVAERLGDLFGVFDRIGRLAARHLDAETVHGFLKRDAVFAALDGIDLDADNLDAVFGQNTGFMQLRAKIEGRLAAQVRQQGIWPFLGDNLSQALAVEWFDVGGVGNTRIGHDRRRVGIDQHDLVAQGAQRLACLRAGIIELAGLADDNRPGADNEDFADIASLWHRQPPLHPCLADRLVIL